MFIPLRSTVVVVFFVCFVREIEVSSALRSFGRICVYTTSKGNSSTSKVLSFVFVPPTFLDTTLVAGVFPIFLFVVAVNLIEIEINREVNRSSVSCAASVSLKLLLIYLFCGEKNRKINKQKCRLIR